MALDLPFLWAAIIAFAVLAYVILDGFDLGVGILFPFFKEKHDRDVMMNSVAPVWDGNETWLVLGGGGLMAVFPLAYATILPALYMPLILMLLGLIFRGVAFEYRWRTKRGEFLWDIAFAGGSMVAAFMQGVALGALVQGIPVTGRAYAGGWWDWLTPFSVATGIALLIGYGLLGATWLVMKTTGELAARAPPCLARRHRHAGRHGRLQPLDALPGAALFRPLVRLADDRLQPAGSASGARLLRHADPGLEDGARFAAVHRRARPLRARLCRHRHQLLSLYRAGLADDLGGRRA